MIRSIALIFIFIFAFSSCHKKYEFLAHFDNTHDRVWVGRDFWSIPLEDWKVEDGALHCTGAVTGSRVNLLTHVLSPEAGSFNLSVKAGLVDEGRVPGAAGVLVGERQMKFLNHWVRGPMKKNRGAESNARRKCG